jgi:hypothetical protein
MLDRNRISGDGRSVQIVIYVEVACGLRQLVYDRGPK